MSTVRRVPESDLDRYRRLIEYAFHPEDGPGLDEEPPDRIADRYGLYENGRLLTTGALYGLDARLRSEWTTVGGIAAVSSPPEHRGSGNVRRLLRGLLAESRERGFGLTALWPFEHAFYRQFGWAIANRYTTYALSPEQLATAGTTNRGSYEPVGPDDWERLEAAQRAHGEGVTLSLRRSEDWWRQRIFDDGNDQPWAYAWLADGEVRGYVVYTFEAGDDGQILRVRDFSASDRAARRHLLGLLGTHDSQAETVELTLAEEADLLDAVSSPEDIECSIHAGPMVRASDVELALEQCPYPEDASGRVVVDVSDPMGVDDGRFELAVEDGVGVCEPTTAEPDATVDVGTLSQLVVGYRDVSMIRRQGLDCDDTTADHLRALFPPETVCLREFF